MSIYPLIRVWDHSRQRGTALLLLLAMADRADELGVCWAGTNWLAGRARLERRQTIRTIQQLERDEEIVVIRSRKSNGQNVVNHYIVSIGATPDILTAAHERIRELLELRGGVVEDTSVVDDTRVGGQDDTRVGGQDDTRVVAGMTPDPSSYPEEKNVTLTYSEIWSLALDELEMQMTRSTFRKHLESSAAAESAGADELIVLVNQASIPWLESRFAELIQRVVTDIAERPLTIRYQAK
jgi:hypothetical protein